MTQNYQMDAVSLNFRKAFDCVPHKRLLMKTEKKTWNILKSFEMDKGFSNKPPTTCAHLWCIVSSEWTEVFSGVPRAMSWGPCYSCCM